MSIQCIFPRIRRAAHHGHAITVCLRIVPTGHVANVTITEIVALTGFLMENLYSDVMKGVFLMARGVLIFIIVCICLIFGMGDISYTASEVNPALMQKHMEKMKHAKPQKYRAMVERAGGNINDCFSCHGELFKGAR